MPKRTGRKRKRGTDGPFEGTAVTGGQEVPSDSLGVGSVSSLDSPLVLRRKLADNVGRYTVEPVGVVRNTHRYRGGFKSWPLSHSSRV